MGAGEGRPHPVAHADADTSDDGRDESPAEKLDRNWNELLQELRVVQTGVQILTGFLLTLPFQQRFTKLDGLEKGIFLTAVLLAVAAAALLIAPVSSHRLLFRRHEKGALVGLSNELAKAGITVLGLAVTVVTLLVFDVVLGRGWAALAAAGVALFYLTTWLVLPLALLAAERRRS
jgi:uncharacterized protein DUF6328